MPEVDKVQYEQLLQQSEASPTTGSSSNDNQTPPCWCCGDKHFVRDCAYRQHVCQDCMGTGPGLGATDAVFSPSKSMAWYTLNFPLALFAIPHCIKTQRSFRGVMMTILFLF